MTYPDPDDPAPPARPSVRPFLQFGLSPADGHRPAHAAQTPPAGEQSTTLRPFVITSGRTGAADPDIGVETQVTVNRAAAPMHLSPEQRAIVSLCDEPYSVAEISARLRLHLGVTRILVGDLRAAGQLDVHPVDAQTPDPDTILRVIRGLRAIT
jgi:Protein of unknown function (DUF742)